ncbi:hypothetical protein [Ureibacillus terrenus]|uniref:Uncharacterized protein n=1 Tax=Ureibacillus terrenus TaxID=118246 RepID=A0A540V3S8_9BACL|nr:hypothetical protein [Ureibacillus terrenus]MED3660907.1 hypothetical protein [Ureibacillus terrenus]MED3763080.1 hypothetical protein [Ureibacillus terrenus]TQE91406.1 hypothetical protein FKZ59_05360 [Ureibacillus terrenus]
MSGIRLPSPHLFHPCLIPLYAQHFIIALRIHRIMMPGKIKTAFTFHLQAVLRFNFAHETIKRFPAPAILSP